MTHDYDGQLTVGKIKVDHNLRMATQYRIQGAPTFIVFSLGEIKGRRTGAQSERQLEDLLDEAGAFALEPQGADEEDEEEIRKRLRALGYVE